MRQYRQEQKRHDVGDLDHRVHRGTSRILVRIAHRVTGDGGLVRLAALLVGDAILVGKAVLEGLLGVVPGTATCRHRDGHEEAGHDHAEEHGAECRKRISRCGNRANDIEHDDRRQNGRSVPSMMPGFSLN